MDYSLFKSFVLHFDLEHLPLYHLHLSCLMTLIVWTALRLSPWSSFLSLLGDLIISLGFKRHPHAADSHVCLLSWSLPEFHADLIYPAVSLDVITNLTCPKWKSWVTPQGCFVTGPSVSISTCVTAVETQNPSHPVLPTPISKSQLCLQNISHSDCCSAPPPLPSWSKPPASLAWMDAVTSSSAFCLCSHPPSVHFHRGCCHHPLKAYQVIILL